ncbi:hypothetical protein ACFZCP_45065 [Streptomyces sp. NPDC007971]|uniref:hypothetical protein n=1 Tax=Streptomyces sp. NPDC007971 TaxID=3364799 RepID=UPI0036EF2CFC
MVKELLGVYAHVRLRLQRDVIDALGTVLGGRETTKTVSSDGDEPPPCTALVHCRCRQLLPSPHAEAPPGRT